MPILLILAALAVRLPFMSRRIFAGDSLNYCMGALRLHVAHPPGYIGYCWLGRVVNGLVGNINTTFSLISLVAALGATAVTYHLARAMGLGVRAAALAAAAYTFSVNTLALSTMAANNTVEGFIAVSFADLAWHAVARRSVRLSMLATLTLAVGAAVRPTMLGFLLPLWIYGVVRARCAWWEVVVQGVVAAVIVIAWQSTANAYMRQQGFISTFEMQVMMPTHYDYSKLSATDVDRGVERRATFHMPIFEIAMYVQRKLHVSVIAERANWPAPSMARAVRLIGLQVLKLGYYLVLSMPLLVVLVVRRLWSGGTSRGREEVDGLHQRRTFLLLWIVPACLFFMVGHMGAIGYLQVFLPGLAIGVAAALMEKGGMSSKLEGRWGRWVWLAPAASALFFVTARPFRVPTGGRHVADLILLQYTGAAIREGFATARGNEGGLVSSAVRDCKSDEELLRVCKEFAPCATQPVK